MTTVPVVDDVRHCLFHCQHHRLMFYRQQFLTKVPEAMTASTLAELFSIAGPIAGKLRATVHFVAMCHQAVYDALFEDEDEYLEELEVVTDPEDGGGVNFVFDGIHDWMPPDLESD